MAKITASYIVHAFYLVGIGIAAATQSSATTSPPAKLTMRLTPGLPPADGQVATLAGETALLVDPAAAEAANERAVNQWAERVKKKYNGEIRP